MLSRYAVQFVLCLSIVSFKEASTTDNGDDLQGMRSKLTEIIDLANETRNIRHSYEGGKAKSLRYFDHLTDSHMNRIIAITENFIKHVDLEKNGKWSQAQDPSRSFKSFAWTTIRDIVDRAQRAEDFTYTAILEFLTPDRPAALKFNEARGKVQSLKAKANEVKDSSYLSVDPGEIRHRMNHHL